MSFFKGWKTMEQVRSKQLIFFAEDAFHYLSKECFSCNVLPESLATTHYHKYVGEACVYKLHAAKKTSREILDREYPFMVMGSRQFVEWFKKVFKEHLSPSYEDLPFIATLESLVFMFEAAVYAFGKGNPFFYQKLPIMWTEFFMENLYNSFYYGGTWPSLIKVAKDAITKYEAGEGDGLEILKRLRISEIEEARKTPYIAIQVIYPRGGETELNEPNNFEKTVNELSNLKINVLSPAEGEPALNEPNNFENTLNELSKFKINVLSPAEEEPALNEPNNFENTVNELSDLKIN